MKKILLITLMLFTLLLAPCSAFAQGMMDNWTGSSSSVPSDDHTVQEEAEGKEIWEKLQAKQPECKDLTDEKYGSLGEYYMGQMTGNSHAAMNTMMTQMIGEDGEEQMHIVMGKRLSGCDISAQLPQNGVGFMPMMWMMGSAFAPESFGGTKGGGNPMMGTGWNGFGLLGWVPMLLFWVLLILGVIALLRYLGKSGQSQEGKTPLDILKERYARGEIDKKEFEEKKKVLS